MAEGADQSKGSFATGLGGLFGLLARELGAAVAVIGGLWAGYTTIAAAERSVDHPWPLYLVGGGVFVALVIACRWRGRG
jgi:hypothetical protein